LQRWEYLTIGVTGSTWTSAGRTGTLPAVDTPRGQSAWPPDALCNAIGAEGWELCGVAGTAEISNYTLFFKRPKP
jgi:hypothetical protein